MKITRRKGRGWMLDFYDDQRRRRQRAFRTREQAEAAMTDLRRRLQRGTYVAPSRMPTLAELAEQWLAGKRAHRPASQAHWHMHLNRHILPELGTWRVDRLTVERIEVFRDDLATQSAADGKPPLGPRSVNKVLTTLAAVLRLAVRRGIIDTNPGQLAERLREQSGAIEHDAEDSRNSKPDETLAPDEINRLLNASDRGLYHTLFLTAALTGARPSEILALMWGDIDLETGHLSIRRAFSWARAPGETGPARARAYEPKTRAGRRTIELGPELVATLKRWKLEAPPSDLDLVFPAADGSPLHRSTMLRRGLRPSLRRAGLRRVGMMAFRHAHASALLAAGAPITYVQHRPGHANPAVTLRVYSHWVGRQTTDALGKLARAITTTGPIPSDPTARQVTSPAR